MNELITEKMSEVVSSKIGLTIGPDHVHTDENGWVYYIPAKSLHEWHPLVMKHYRGPFFIVIPHKDWNLLEQQIVSVEDYVENSTWSFGYYWGGGSVLGGVQWMPFEEKGIHEREKINRYLTILSCRTSRRFSGYLADEQKCAQCSVKNCPFSRFHQNASWDNEVKELDDRILLFKAVKERIQNRFGLEATLCLNQENNSIWIFPSYKKGTVTIRLPEATLIDMLYNPGKYDTDEVANSLKLEAGISWQYVNGEFIPPKRVDIPEGADAKFLYDCWKDDSRYQNWLPEVKSISEKVEKETHEEQPDKRIAALLERIQHAIREVL